MHLNYNQPQADWPNNQYSLPISLLSMGTSVSVLVSSIQNVNFFFERHKKCKFIPLFPQQGFCQGIRKTRTKIGRHKKKIHLVLAKITVLVPSIERFDIKDYAANKLGQGWVGILTFRVFFGQEDFYFLYSQQTYRAIYNNFIAARVCQTDLTGKKSQSNPRLATCNAHFILFEAPWGRHKTSHEGKALE